MNRTILLHVNYINDYKSNFVWYNNRQKINKVEDEGNRKGRERTQKTR